MQMRSGTYIFIITGHVQIFMSLLPIQFEADVLDIVVWNVCFLISAAQVCLQELGSHLFHCLHVTPHLVLPPDTSSVALLTRNSSTDSCTWNSHLRSTRNKSAIDLQIIFKLHRTVCLLFCQIILWSKCQGLFLAYPSSFLQLYCSLNISFVKTSCFLLLIYKLTVPEICF